MRALIVEDEQLAADRLSSIINKIDKSVEVVAQLDTVRDTVAYLKQHQQDLDLLFCDIHLADGLSFEIFEQVEVETPVIFTTAYDEYSIKAFKVNSVDYLLKPIQEEEVRNSLNKYSSFFEPNLKGLADLKSLFANSTKTQPKRFLVKAGMKLIPKKADDIAFAFVENKVTYFLDINTEKTYMMDFTLEELMSTQLDIQQFYRINRRQIVNIESIDVIRPYLNQRLSLSLKVHTNQELIVSREKVNDFKKWFLN